MDPGDFASIVIVGEGPASAAVRRVAETLAGLLGASIRSSSEISTAVGDDGQTRAIVVARGEDALSGLLASVRSVDIPVVVVPPTTAAFRLRTVLVPLTAPVSGSWGLAATVELATDLDLDVVVVHVEKPGVLPAFSDQPQHETEAWAYSLLSRYLPVAPDRVSLELRVGSPAEQILDVADGRDVDLIILPWARDLSPGRAEVVRGVLEGSSVPVILLPLVGTLSPA
jgi:nucleotide-binding universal stress UspA family protein